MSDKETPIIEEVESGFEEPELAIPEMDGNQKPAEPRTKKWSKREYYVIDAKSGITIAENFASEKEARAWIASPASSYDTPYIIAYRVGSLNPITKTQKTVLK